MSIFRAAVVGALWSLLSAFPIAALMALVFRFPIPFGGILSGPNAVIPAMFAVVFYGMLGGFIVVGVGGALAGILSAVVSRDPQRRQLLRFALPVAVTTVLLLALATLDWFIGPW